MEKKYVYYDSEIQEEKNIKLSIRSKAFNYGLGCFEGIRAYWDEEAEQLYVFRMKEHYKRLLDSCKTLSINIPYTVEDMCAITVKLLKKNQMKTSTYIRPVAYKSSNSVVPTLADSDDSLAIYDMELGSYAGKDELDVCITSWRRLNSNMLPARTKATAAYMNSALASLEAKQNGYDEAVFLTDNDNVCEGPGENLFIVKNGKLVTPPPSDNILEGITRATVMEIAKNELGIDTVERSISRAELYAADEMFFTGTAMEVTSVVTVDRRKIGTGHQGEVTEKIKSLFEGITKGKNPKYKEFCTKVY